MKDMVQCLYTLMYLARLLLILTKLNSCVEGICNDSYVSFTIHFDSYPDETSWELLNHNGTSMLIGNGSDYDPSSTITDSICINSIESGSCFSLYVYDAFIGGICCFYGDGWFELFVNNVSVTSNIKQTFLECSPVYLNFCNATLINKTTISYYPCDQTYESEKQEQKQKQCGNKTSNNTSNAYTSNVTVYMPTYLNYNNEASLNVYSVDGIENNGIVDKRYAGYDIVYDACNQQYVYNEYCLRNDQCLDLVFNESCYTNGGHVLGFRVFINNKSLTLFEQYVIFTQSVTALYWCYDALLDENTNPNTLDIIIGANKNHGAVSRNDFGTLIAIYNITQKNNELIFNQNSWNYYSNNDNYWTFYLKNGCYEIIVSESDNAVSAEESVELSLHGYYIIAVNNQTVGYGGYFYQSESIIFCTNKNDYISYCITPYYCTNSSYHYIYQNLNRFVASLFILLLCLSGNRNNSLFTHRNICVRLLFFFIFI